MLARDHQALEGLPLKLLIMSLLVSMTAPAVMGSLDGYERSLTCSEMMSEASRLARLTEEVLSAGEGNRRSITMELPTASSRYGMIIEVGGGIDNASKYTIRCLEEEKVFSTIVLDDPPVRTITKNGSPLTLDAGTVPLMLECARIEGRLCVVVEAIP